MKDLLSFILFCLTLFWSFFLAGGAAMHTTMEWIAREAIRWGQ